MLSPLVTGKVEKGKFIPDKPDVMKSAFYCHEGRRVSFQPKRIYDTRSNQENRYYWGVVVKMIADYMGERDMETVHGYLKQHFNFVIKPAGDKVFKLPQSTAMLKTKEFEDYLDRVREFASIDLGLYIPMPNEVDLTA